MYAMQVVVQWSATNLSQGLLSSDVSPLGPDQLRGEDLNPIKLRECAIGSGQSRTSHLLC